MPISFQQGDLYRLLHEAGRTGDLYTIAALLGDTEMMRKCLNRYYKDNPNLLEPGEEIDTIIHQRIQETRDTYSLPPTKPLDINYTDEELPSIIHTACESGKVNLVCYLVDTHKADLSLRNKNGITAVQYAEQINQREIAKVLEDRKNIAQMKVSTWQSMAAATFNVISTVAFVLSTACHIVGSLPFAKLVTAPIEAGLNLLGYAAWDMAVKYDPYINKITNENIQYKARETSILNRGAAWLGGFAMLSALAAVIFPPIAPIALVVAGALLVASDTAWAVGCWKDYNAERDFGEKTPGHDARVSSKASYATYATMTTVAAGLALGALFLAAAFPPVGIALAFVAAACVAVGIIGLVSSWISSRKATKLDKAANKDANLAESEPKLVDKNEIDIEFDLSNEPGSVLDNASALGIEPDALTPTKSDVLEESITDATDANKVKPSFKEKLVENSRDKAKVTHQKDIETARIKDASRVKTKEASNPSSPNLSKK